MNRANRNQRASRARQERRRRVADCAAIERFAVSSPVDDREAELSAAEMALRRRRQAQRDAFITNGRRAA